MFLIWHQGLHGMSPHPCPAPPESRWVIQAALEWETLFFSGLERSTPAPFKKGPVTVALTDPPTGPVRRFGAGGG